MESAADGSCCLISNSRHRPGSPDVCIFCRPKKSPHEDVVKRPGDEEDGDHEEDQPYRYLGQLQDDPDHDDRDEDPKELIDAWHGGDAGSVTGQSGD